MTFETRPLQHTTLLILRGISGSGKSTVAQKIQNQNANTVVVSRDFLRLGLYNREYGPPIDEDFITVIEDKIIAQALGCGISVISDNTNLTPRIIKHHIRRAYTYGVDIVLQEVECSLDLAKFNNAQRGSKGGRLVPPHVIESQHELFYQHQNEIAQMLEPFAIAP